MKELSNRNKELFNSMRELSISIESSVNGSFSDNFNFSMKNASRAYNLFFISKRHVVFN